LLAKFQDKGKGSIKAEGWIDTLYADITSPMDKRP